MNESLSPARRHILQQALRQEHQRLLALQAISSRISAIFDLDQLLEELVQSVRTTLSYYNTLIFMIDEEETSLRLKASGRPLVPEMRDFYFSIESHPGLGKIISSKEPVFIPDISQCAFCIPSSPDVRAAIIAPMMVGGRAVGLFQVESDAPDDLHKQDLQLISSLANQAGASIEAARLLAKSRATALALGRWVRNLMIVNRIAATLTSTLDSTEILRTTTQHLVEMTDVDYGCALVLGPDTQHGVIVAEHPERELTNLRLPLPSPTMVQQISEMRTPYVVDGPDGHPLLGPIREQSPSLEVNSMLIVPLVARGEAIGTLLLMSSTPHRIYSEEEQDVCQTVASQAAVALANAQLLEDIQQQKRTLTHKSQELREESSKLDAILSNIADGLVVTETGGRILLSNPAFCEMAGLPQVEPLSGCLLEDAFPAEQIQPLTEQALDSPGGVFSDNIELSNGRILRASVTALRLQSPVATAPMDVEEQIAGVVIVLRDITHEAEVDRMKTDFISAVTHELRSPLTSILGFASLIQRDLERQIIPQVKEDTATSKAAERAMTNLSIIEGESMRLTRLINDMLDIAKMEAGRMEWRMAKASLPQAISQAVASTTALAEDKGLTIKVELPDHEMPSVWGDPDRLIQVMTNLLGNAIKFTEEGEIRVRGWELTVSGKKFRRKGPTPPSYKKDLLPTLSLADGDWVVVSVTDTGVGIRPEDLPHAFEKFRQVGDAADSHAKGTGLGLSICKEIVEHHGGLIWAESKQGKGSTFSFALPRRLTQQDAPAESDESAAG